MVQNMQRERRPRRVVSKKQDKTDKKASEKKVKSSGGGVYYSFMTIVLLLCLIQITISAVLNISKIVSYKAKIIQITKTRDAAQALNEQLQDNIKNFSNVAGLEAIARNNLKMSGEDEVLVIINTPQEDENSEKNEKNGLIGLMRHD